MGSKISSQVVAPEGLGSSHNSICDLVRSPVVGRKLLLFLTGESPSLLNTLEQMIEKREPQRSGENCLCSLIIQFLVYLPIAWQHPSLHVASRYKKWV